MKEIQIKCKGATTLRLEELVEFQGNLKDLSKENYEKLKKQIIELGFSEPVSVWKRGKENILLNGHQRLRTIRQMVEHEGYEAPKIPVNWIEAKDDREAKKKVLSLTSQYGELTGQGLNEFMAAAGLGFSEVEKNFRFPEVSFSDFEKEFIKDGAEFEEGEVKFSEYIGESNNYVVLVFKNEVDWLAARSHFDIGQSFATRKNGKTTWSSGVGKVIDGAGYLRKVQ